MENLSNSVEDIKTIRKMMEESSRFLSLSGLSGIFAGVAAITGALAGSFLLFGNGEFSVENLFKVIPDTEVYNVRWWLAIIANLVLIISVVAAFILSNRKALKDGKSLFTPVSKKMLFNLLIPLVTGGIFVMILFSRSDFQLIIPCLLIFYGLALVNAGKFTVGEVLYLGLAEILLGLVTAFHPGLGLISWILGFGILHIIYGISMYRKFGA
jgi:hypothetical protein